MLFLEHYFLFLKDVLLQLDAESRHTDFMQLSISRLEPGLYTKTDCPGTQLTGGTHHVPTAAVP